MHLIKADKKKIWEHAHYLRIKNEMKKLAAAEAKKKEKVNMEIEEFQKHLIELVQRETLTPPENIYEYNPNEREE